MLPANGATLLERFMPVYHFRERHSTTVRATPERVMQAILAVTPDKVALFRLLMGVRALPARLAARVGADERTHEEHAKHRRSPTRPPSRPPITSTSPASLDHSPITRRD